MEYAPHELAKIFPSMSDEEITDLVADITKNGLVEPIVLFEGAVLDGVHRQQACAKAGVSPRYIEFGRLPREARKGGPVNFAVSKNLKRRNLTTGQRAMVAATLANLPAHRPEKNNPANLPGNEPITQSQAAKSMHVSERSVRAAKKLEKEHPDEAAEVKAGKKSLSRATGESEKAAKKKEQLESAYVRIEKVCGKAFADAVRKKVRLKNPKHVLEFASMDTAEMRKVAGLIVEGWPLKKARLYKAKNLTRRHLIEDLFNKAAHQGGSFEVEIDRWRINVERIRHTIA